MQVITENSKPAKWSKMNVSEAKTIQTLADDLNVCSDFLNNNNKKNFWSYILMKEDIILQT